MCGTSASNRMSSEARFAISLERQPVSTMARTTSRASEFNAPIAPGARIVCVTQAFEKAGRLAMLVSM